MTMCKSFASPNQDIQAENFERTILENPQQKPAVSGSDAEHLEGEQD